MQQAAPSAIQAPAMVADRANRRGSTGDVIFSGVATASGLLVLGLLGAIIIMLFLGGLQAFQAAGLGFLTSDVWDPVTDEYGALVPIFGTLVTSILALIFAWNSFLFPLILAGVETKTLPVLVYSFMTFDFLDLGGIYAASTLITLPVVVMVLAVQRHFIRGLTIGGVKG